MSKKAISPEVLKILACPVCKRAVKLKGKELVCVGCGQHYPIIKGIPCLLPPELTPMKKR